MAATQRDIRVFEAEQEAGMPSAPEPVAPVVAPTSLPVSKAIGGTLPLGPRLPDIQTTSPAMDQAVGGMLQNQKDLNSRLGALQPEVDARRAALSSELERPLPTPPNLKEVPQFQARTLSQEDISLFTGITMVLAGLGTKAMRGDLTMALNAAGAAMKGFNEGNLQQSRLEMEQFNKTMEGVIAENRRMSEEYRQIIESRKLSLEQKSQALRVAASARDDQIMLSALQSGQLRTVFDLEAYRINATNQAAVRSAQIYNAALENLAPKEEPLVPVQKPDGSVVYAPRSQAVGATVPDRNKGDRLTEGEAKGTLFWRQMTSAEEAARGLAGPQFDVSNLGSQLGVRMAGSDLTNWLAPEKAQQYAQAAEQWAEAYLRLKTGAATTKDEIQRNARAYFPQPGDEPQTIIQKNQMRAKAIDDVSIVAGRGVGKEPASGGAGAQQFTEGQTATGPGGKKIVFRGGKWVPL